MEYVRYTIPEERRATFECAYVQAARSLDASTECLAYDLAQCVDDPAVYILRIEWASPEGHLQGFRKSPEFEAFFAAVKPFVADIAEMRHYAVTSVARRKIG
jgi:hemoglobin